MDVSAHTHVLCVHVEIWRSYLRVPGAHFNRNLSGHLLRASANDLADLAHDSQLFSQLYILTSLLAAYPVARVADASLICIVAGVCRGACLGSFRVGTLFRNRRTSVTSRLFTSIRLR